ncbi:MAG: head-tail connector protein [Hyphomicrobium sp.]|jgi:hypothetical protein
MTFLTLAQAKLHCRIDGTDGDADLTIKISAAERAASEYIQCEIYLTQAALTSAISQTSGTLESAKEDYDDAIDEADLLTDADLIAMEKQQALDVYNRAKYAASRVRNGVVINDLILAAMLLIVGWLYEVREDGEPIPKAARDLLHPFKSY